CRDFGQFSTIEGENHNHVDVFVNESFDVTDLGIGVVSTFRYLQFNIVVFVSHGYRGFRNSAHPPVVFSRGRKADGYGVTFVVIIRHGNLFRRSISAVLVWRWFIRSTGCHQRGCRRDGANLHQKPAARFGEHYSSLRNAFLGLLKDVKRFYVLTCFFAPLSARCCWSSTAITMIKPLVTA